MHSHVSASTLLIVAIPDWILPVGLRLLDVAGLLALLSLVRLGRLGYTAYVQPTLGMHLGLLAPASLIRLGTLTLITSSYYNPVAAVRLRSR